MNQNVQFKYSLDSSNQLDAYLYLCNLDKLFCETTTHQIQEVECLKLKKCIVNGDLKFSNLNFDHSCAYMNKKYMPNTDSSKYLAELKTYCNIIKPFVSHYSKLIKSYNDTVYNILTSEIRLLLLHVSNQKHGLVSTIVSGFIGLAYEGISSFLQIKQKDALQKAVIAMNNEVNFQCHKLLKLDNTMLMYGIYNAETLEKLINTV